MERAKRVGSMVLCAALAACGGPAATASPEAESPSGSLAPSIAPPSASPPAPTEAAVRVITDVAYQVDPDGRRRVTDVWVPAGDGGPWPVVVMFHGGGGFPLIPSAQLVAAEGAVVFAPLWSMAAFPWPNAEAYRADSREGLGRLACVVQFARAEATRYGGDPSNVTLYGHSAGANHAVNIAFDDPEIGAGCLAETGSIVPQNLVLFEGDWNVAGDPVWDTLLREDPTVLDAEVPWSRLETATRMPVRILDSGDATLARTDVEEFFTLRDPTGQFRQWYEEAGALADGTLSETDAQRVFFNRLRDLGYPATFHELPGSTHTFISAAALPIVLDAIRGTP